MSNSNDSRDALIVVIVAILGRNLHDDSNHLRLFGIPQNELLQE